jgi:phosphatidylglycerol---prolipoprotein diacylglyceryl transferase
MLPAVIDWTVDPIALSLGGLQVRWYGLCFLACILVSIKIMEPMFRRLGRDPEEATSLTIHVVIGIIVGSRLIHCLFYDPHLYLPPEGNPLRIFKIWEGGLASHGGTLGAIVASYMWVNNVVNRGCDLVVPYTPGPIAAIADTLFGRPLEAKGITWRQLADIAAPAIATAICFIRFGNLMNHEIVGRGTDAPWAFRFHRYLTEATWRTQADPSVSIAEKCPLLLGEQVANDPALAGVLAEAPALSDCALHIGRHPTQIYEVLTGFAVFLLISWLAWRRDGKHRDGFRLFLFLLLWFILRFAVEYFKEYQAHGAMTVAEAARPALTMGQKLSLPFVLGALPLVLWTWRSPEAGVGKADEGAPPPPATT